MNNKYLAWCSVAALLVCTLFGGGAWAAQAAGGAGGEGGEASSAADEPRMPVMTTVSAKDVVRGSPVTVAGQNFGKEAELISLTLGDLPIGHPTVASDESFTFIVPATVGEGKAERPLPLGESLLRVSIESPLHVLRMAANPYKVGKLHVHADSTGSVKLDAVSPRVSHTTELTKLALLGEGLPEQGRDLALLVDGKELPLCWADEGCEVRASVTSHELTLEGKGSPAEKAASLTRLFGLGKHQLALRLAESKPTEPVELTITEYTSGDIRWRAVLVGVALLVAIGLLVVKGGTYTVGRTRYVLRAFLIDTETESFSLAKLQFFLWTIAALLAYAYLVLSRFFVQGQFELPDVPEGLPGIIAISAGTAVGSIGITAARGPKGAGTAEPSFADLVSVGGVVSPERFQFLLWTLVAVVTFLCAALQLDPLQIETLPKVPPTLLALSGVSSAGYLGGKLVRAPGPVISEVLVGAGSLILTISGRNLSRFARFEINGKSITPLLAHKASDDSPFRAQVLEPETAAGAQDYAKSLELTIAKTDPAWLLGNQPPKLELSIINQDGQRSAYELELEVETWRAFAGLPKRRSATKDSPPKPSEPPTDNTIHNDDSSTEKG